MGGQGFLEGYVATQSVWSRFRRWRRTRPFWGGLFLLLSALALFLSANLTLADMQVHFGQEGYLSYVLPVVLVLCGLLAWFSPGQRLFYGILGLLTALYSFLGLNLGGFGLGMLLGIVGGALTIAWGPVRKPPAPAAPVQADTAADEPDEPDEPDAPADDEQSPETERIDVAGSDLPPRSPYTSDPATEIMPGFGDEPEQPQQSPNGGTHRKLLVITLVPLAVAAAVLAGGGRSPARAADCPDGMPSRSAAGNSAAQKQTTATGSSAAKKQTTATKKPAIAKPRSSSPKAKPGAKTTPEDDKADPEPSASPSADDRNPVIGGLQDLIGGIGKALGIGGDETPSPSPPASPTASPSPAPSTSPTPSATPTAHPAAPGGTGGPGTSASPTPAPSSSDIPCLGARVLGKEAGSAGIPQVALKPGLLEGDSLQMYGSTYDGVSDMTTADGSYRALKFSMDKSVTKPFTLTIPEPGGGTTVIKTAALTTDGHVQFFTPRFEGKLFGLIPVVFTPDSPPPLTLPYLWFTDVKIDLAFVSCDPVLTINEEQPANG
jgi:Family of unknown function (DUF6114)